MGAKVQSRDLHDATAPYIYTQYIHSSRGEQHVTKHLSARLPPKVVGRVTKESIIVRRLELMMLTDTDLSLKPIEN